MLYERRFKMKIKVKFNTAIVFPIFMFSANSVVEIDEELVKPLIEKDRN
jgi:hypothetical protein